MINALSVINALKCVFNGHKYNAKNLKSIKSILKILFWFEALAAKFQTPLMWKQTPWRSCRRRAYAK
jgi:hypothetical protein